MNSILEALRQRNVKIRRTPAGKLQISTPALLDEAVKQEIRLHRDEILNELDVETAQAAVRSEIKAQEILEQSQHKPPRVLVTEECEGIVFITCRRRDGSGWTIQVPREEWDPWKLATMLVSAAPGKFIE